MMRLSKVVGIAALIAAFSVICLAQTNPNNVPKPPTAELKKFEPFLGKYTQTMDYAGLKWSGTFEIKPAIKGWYIERTILPRTVDGKSDREFRSMITYDSALGHYRIWRFETVPPMKKNEGVGRFEGDVFIEGYELDTPEGGKRILRNRMTLPNKDEIRIVTEIQRPDGIVSQLGVSIGKRMK